jgi:uncharacterized protein (DUF305 family)
MNGRVVTILVAVVLALAAGIGIGAAIWAGGDHGDDAASTTTDHGMGSMDGMMTTGALDEQSFMEQMVPHHESAVEMATMALEKSTRPQVRQLAQEIIDAQEGEIAQMGEWHLQWYGSGLQASDAWHMDMGDLEEATGPEFDRRFLRMMIAHHASAIMMADAVMIDPPRAEVATMAGEIIAAQSKEVGEMQGWREQWFPPIG